MALRQHTTDEWAELVVPQLTKNIDAELRFRTALEPEDAYSVRRHIIMYIRQELEGRGIYLK